MVEDVPVSPDDLANRNNNAGPSVFKETEEEKRASQTLKDQGVKLLTSTRRL